ncbi:hypothetical protein KQH26_00445 [bacterium]|nr:hypothetical protein [bacterium]
MEKEDKMIKALLQDKFIERAPDGFTGKVMQSIEVAELQKEKTYRYDWPYLLIIAGSVLFALGIVAFIDSSFISRNFYVFLGYTTDFFHLMSGIFDHTQLTNTSVLSGSGLMIGTFIIMIVLLFFDGFVWRKKRYLNLFAWSF